MWCKNRCFYLRQGWQLTHAGLGVNQTIDPAEVSHLLRDFQVSFFYTYFIEKIKKKRSAIRINVVVVVKMEGMRKRAARSFWFHETN